MPSNQMIFTNQHGLSKLVFSDLYIFDLFVYENYVLKNMSQTFKSKNKIKQFWSTRRECRLLLTHCKKYVRILRHITVLLAITKNTHTHSHIEE